jgi:two-component system, cell cycle response regulator DivK
VTRRTRPAYARKRTARDPGPLVLVVEDNSDLRELYSAYFLAHGFRVQGASDGHSTFTRAVDLRPDLIVTDLSMPHLDGWEAIRRLKADLRTRHIPVLVCTGHAFGGVDRALDAGCDAYLVKPCLPEVLLAEARRLLARSSARRFA